MSGLLACLDEMATQIRENIGTEVFGIQVEVGWVFNPSPPTIDLYPGDPSRDPTTASFAGEDGPYDGGYEITVRARVPTADTTEGQRLLIQMMDDASDLSIAAALYEDPTLNGHASSLYVRPSSGYRDYEGVLGFQFTCLVLAAQS